MAKLLTDLGFDARSVTDRDAGELRRDLERFAEDAEAPMSPSLLFRPRHRGGRREFLVPVDADVPSLKDADEALVPHFRRDGRAEEDRAGDDRAARCLPHQSVSAGRRGRRRRPLRPSRSAPAVWRRCAAPRHSASSAGDRREPRHGDWLCRRTRPPGARWCGRRQTAPMRRRCCAISRR